MDDISDLWIPLVLVFLIVWMLVGINWWLVSIVVAIFFGMFCQANAD